MPPRHEYIMNGSRGKHVFEDLRPLDNLKQRHTYSDATFAASTYPTRSQIPINLVLLIISHVDDITTLASVTRASRLLYYLTLPRLYEHVTLNAYSSIRYVGDHPEGYGGGSPFAMGLDALVSSPNNVAQYVKEMTLRGQWKETDTQEFEKGRVPDNTMMLNIVIKAAITRAGRLERFNWALDTKPMKTVYQGLALRGTLTHFRLRFPSSRIPRPAVLIPAIPSLRSLKLSNLDPLCYNDDVSLLISEARQLEVLHLHWSRRMRTAREPSVYLQNYLGRLAEARYKLRTKELHFFNMFARNDGTMSKCFEFETLESIAFLNCMEHDDPTTVFVDNSWLFDDSSQPPMKKLRRMRMDKVDRTFPKVIKHFQNIEEIYIVSGKIAREQQDRRTRFQMNGRDSASPGSMTQSPQNMDRASNSIEPTQRVTIADLPDGASAATNSRPSNSLVHMDWTSSTMSPDLSSASPGPAPSLSPHKFVALASDAIAVISNVRGPQIRKLLLPDAWTLGKDVIMHLVEHCPNLEQLGLAMELGSFEFLRGMIGKLPKLIALRLLIPPDSEVFRAISSNPELHYHMLESETWKDEYNNLVWLGIGGEIARLCGREKVVVPVEAADVNGDGRQKTKERYRGLVRSVGWHDVKNVDIFALDNLDE